MRTLVTYSSLTGNTKMVAESVFEIVPGDKELVSLNDIAKVDADSFDRIIVGFWVDKGTADARAKKFLKGIKDKEVAYIGTLGAAVDSDHANDVRERVKKLITDKNKMIGGFLCRGKIDPKLVEKMGKFPLKLVHPLTPERLQRIEDAKPHPTPQDLEDAQKYFLSIL